MKLERLSALAELISAVAIVVTLGYLAVQTRQNTAATQAAVRQSMVVEDRELLFKQMEFPFVAAGEYNGRELTRDQRVQLISFLVAMVRVRENQWLQYQNGVIDEATWATYRVPLLIILSQPFSRRWWQIRSEAGEFTEGFVNDVNELLADTPIQTPTSMFEALGLED
jgi:hypothetical protein